MTKVLSENRHVRLQPDLFLLGCKSGQFGHNLLAAETRELILYCLGLSAEPSAMARETIARCGPAMAALVSRTAISFLFRKRDLESSLDLLELGRMLLPNVIR